MTKREILAAGATAATSSDTFTVDQETVGVIVVGLTGSETCTLQIQYDDTNFVDVYIDGTLSQLTATNNIFTVYGPGLYRLNKSASTANVSIHTAS